MNLRQWPRNLAHENILKFVTAIALLILSLSAAPANGASAIEGGLVIMGSAPSTYPKAFTGIGLTAAVEKYFLSWNSGVTARILNEGWGTLYSLSYKQYLIGRPQLLQEGEGEQLSIVPKHWGVFIDGGANFYSVVKTSATDTSTKYQTTGVGLQFTAGGEYPLFFKFFGTMRVTYFNAVGSSSGISSFFIDLGVGRPFSF